LTLGGLIAYSRLPDGITCHRAVHRAETAELAEKYFENNLCALRVLCVMYVRDGRHKKLVDAYGEIMRFLLVPRGRREFEDVVAAAE
jgi:hypothetical protein